MRSPLVRAAVGALSVAGLVAVLAGCALDSRETSLPRDRPTPGLSSTENPIPPIRVSDRAPLGFEVRYVGPDGGFATVRPEDFPR